VADVKNILKNMTIEEKIGQLMQQNANVFIKTDAQITGKQFNNGYTQDELSNIGSVLNFKSFSEVKQLQEEHLKNDRNKIPMSFMMDVIHGYRTIYPIPLALGCSFDPDLVTRCTKMASKEATAGGVHITFTPMVDYVRDARWGRVMETCGEDPLLNGIMGAAQVKAFQGNSLREKGTMATCVKHFAAYGGAEAGKDYNTVELSRHVLREYYLPAYKACIDAGAKMVMPSFNSLDGIPATMNKWLMKQVLKDEWGFNGVTISDYNAIGEFLKHGIFDNEKDAAKAAFSAECDIEMISNTYLHHLKELIEEGVFTEQQLDEAVLRVLELKEELGLFEDPYRGVTEEDEQTAFLTPDSRTLVRKAAEECAVLLKNDGILPLSKDVRKIALIGPLADNNQIKGFWACHGRDDECVTVKEGVSALVPNAEITVVKGCGNLFDDYDRSGFDEAVKAAASADVVVLCLGEPQNYSGEGNSRLDIVLPGVQDELAAAVCEVNPNTVAVTFSGRPLSFARLSNNVKAILHMWFPGTEGGNAAASLLFGIANPCGKLSMSFPYSVGQCPIYYNHLNTGRPKRDDSRYYGYCSNYIDGPNLPFYSFGYGLSYANFVYEGLELSSDKLTSSGAIEAVITVKNDSGLDGKETVMLYMRDLVASTARPIQQLIAFEKVEIKAGQTKQIKFNITESMLRFWNDKDELVSEKGRFWLSTGYADHLIFTKEFELI